MRCAHHAVTVDFPPESARLIDVFGKPINDRIWGQAGMGVGCGLHTPYGADLVQAEPALSLEAFREALLAGEVLARSGSNGNA